MPANILVAVVDGLRASALGAYGNTTFATPALDVFAAQCFVLDNCYAPAADLPTIYRALWPAANIPSLPRFFANHGYATSLVTDDQMLRSIAAASEFDDLLCGGPSTATSLPVRRVNNPSETAIANLFAIAAQAADSTPAGRPRLIWLHACGFYGAWDAPLEYQQMLLDEEDPPPVQAAEPPHVMLQPEDDPDIAFRFATAYAAQTMVLDECWESLMSALGEASANEWLVMLIGARGFPLGEHGRIGGVDTRLYAEQLHVPWMVRFPGGIGRLARSSSLTSHRDVFPTLTDAIGITLEQSQATSASISVVQLAKTSCAPARDSLLATSASARAVRTSRWCLREDRGNARSAAHDGNGRPELFVRPDDRWEANDVAKLCPDTVDELRPLLAD